MHGGHFVIEMIIIVVAIGVLACHRCLCGVTVVTVNYLLRGVLFHVTASSFTTPLPLVVLLI